MSSKRSTNKSHRSRHHTIPDNERGTRLPPTQRSPRQDHDRSRGPGPIHHQYGDNHLQTENKMNKEISAPRALCSQRDSALTPILNSQPRDEIDTNRHIMADEPKMQSESQPGVTNGTRQQDEPRSYPPEQTAEYPRNNNTVKGISVPLPLSSRQTEVEVEDPRPYNSAATNTQSESSSGAVTDTPTQDEPQPLPMLRLRNNSRKTL